MNSANRQEVEEFLRDFKAKMAIWDVLFSARPKNAQTLLDLDMSQSDARRVLQDLKVVEYSQGPLPAEVPGGPPPWVFGREIKNREVYIKISMGQSNSNVICISFHFAEHPMKFPLRTA